MNTKISVEEKSEATRNIHVEIPRDAYDKRFNSLLGNVAQRSNIKGFRPGRAPKALIAKMYGGAVEQDVLNEFLKAAIRDAVEEHDLRIIGSPRFEPTGEKSEDSGPLKFTAAVDIIPEPTIKDYEGLKLEVEVEKEEVADDDVDQELDGLRERFAETQLVEGRSTIQEGDLVTIDYEGTVEGKSFENSKVEDMVVEIGHESLKDEIDSALRGAELGKEIQVSIALPKEGVDEKVAGKTADYKIVAKSIAEKKLPALDDEFAKKTGAGETLEELRSQIKDGRLRQIKEGNEQERMTKLFEALAEKNQFEIPETLIDEEIRQILFEIGALNQRDEKSYSADVTPYREHLAKGAEFRVRRAIILQRLVDQLEVEASEDDVEAWFSRRAEESGRTVDEMKAAFKPEQNLDSIKNMVAREKITTMLFESATIKEKKKKPKEEGSKK